MFFRVKNTTIWKKFSVFDLLCTEKCRGCGAKGEVLCERCKKYIFEHYENKKTTKNEVFKNVYMVGYRDEIIGEMVEEYKYYAMRKLGGVLGEILAKTAILELRRMLGENSEIIIVPLPTARKHIRERGFDHVLRILEGMKEFDSKIRIEKLLLRAKDTVQVGADEKVRRKQAKEAYGINGKVLGKFKNRDLPVVLFDDIWTTGASMIEAAKLLKASGFSEIYGVVLAVNRRGRKPEIRRGDF